MKLPPCLVALGMLAVIAPARAAQSTMHLDEPGWRFELVPYLWAASLDGSIALEPLPETGVDAGFLELFANVDLAASTFFTARKDDFLLLTDVSYTKLDIDERVLTSDVEVDSDVWWILLAGGHRIDTGPSSDLELFAGARYYAIDNDASSSGGVTASRTRNEAWLDPLVGMLYSFGAPGFEFALLADVGGFGVGSDLTYELLPSLSYLFSDSVAMRLAYRWVDVDFEDSDFEYDMRESGLMLGMGFAF